MSINDLIKNKGINYKLLTDFFSIFKKENSNCNNKNKSELINELFNGNKEYFIDRIIYNYLEYFNENTKNLDDFLKSLIIDILEEKNNNYFNYYLSILYIFKINLTFDRLFYKNFYQILSNKLINIKNEENIYLELIKIIKIIETLYNKSHKFMNTNENYFSIVKNNIQILSKNNFNNNNKDIENEKKILIKFKFKNLLSNLTENFFDIFTLEDIENKIIKIYIKNNEIIWDNYFKIKINDLSDINDIIIFTFEFYHNKIIIYINNTILFDIDNFILNQIKKLTILNKFYGELYYLIGYFDKKNEIFDNFIDNFIYDRDFIDYYSDLIKSINKVNEMKYINNLFIFTPKTSNIKSIINNNIIIENISKYLNNYLIFTDIENKIHLYVNYLYKINLIGGLNIFYPLIDFIFQNKFKNKFEIIELLFLILNNCIKYNEENKEEFNDFFNLIFYKIINIEKKILKYSHIFKRIYK